jgi:hypothetical protein
MPDFPHLPLPQRISAPYRHRGIRIDRQMSEITLRNLQDREGHGRGLRRDVSSVSNEWQNKMQERAEENLPVLPSTDIPIFLKIDTDLFDTDSLYSFGIEVISEEADGYVIGASGDNFRSLEEKINKFINEEGKFKNKAAQLWEIVTGDQWRLDHILAPELAEKWQTIQDNDTLIVDVSIACLIKIPGQPSQRNDESDDDYLLRYQAWQERKANIERRRDLLEEQRQEEFVAFINELQGSMASSFVSYSDSFCCRIELSGRALKDLVLNYQHIFDVTEYDTSIYVPAGTTDELAITSTINTPPENSPKICVIDSGIQEGHRLLSSAIDRTLSRSYVTGDASIADMVRNGGHGTKVAGAVLFGNNIPKTGVYNADIFLCNARVLNAGNLLPADLFPPKLMEDIVRDFSVCKIFNLSVASSRPCRITHMSQWAAAIDRLIFENDILFVISTGNIKSTTGDINNPGVKEHIEARRSYPNYLLTNAARISNPSQSCFALTVGSICNNEFEDLDKKSFGTQNQPSAFTRTGPGLWRMIKPDVVEYGGDFVREKGANPNISRPPETSVEVVRTTLGGGNAIGYDVGTSFSAPKVSHILGKILNLFPNASSNLLRALVVQSARLPGEKFRNPQFTDMQFLGYGIPDVYRATANSQRRITMIQEGEIPAREAQLFTIKIPDEIRRAGNEYDVLVEVTLSFTAIPRRTRRKINSYVSTWVDWHSSKFEESYNQFRQRITSYVEGPDQTIEEPSNDEHIQWSIRENVNWGNVRNLRRQDSSIQKDWTILKAYSLPEEFSIAVVGHKGWEKDVFKTVPFAIAVSFEVLNAEVDIYNLIRVENEIEIEL